MPKSFKVGDWVRIIATLEDPVEKELLGKIAQIVRVTVDGEYELEFYNLETEYRYHWEKHELKKLSKKEAIYYEL